MKGILFKPDMIQAIVEGRKTQTRRLGGLKEINQEPDIWELAGVNQQGKFIFERDRRWHAGGMYEVKLAKPRYQVGETVYIKEAWAVDALWNNKKPSEINRLASVWYPNDSDLSNISQWVGKLRSALFMPEWAARHFLKILAVRAERLQEITEEGAIAEAAPWLSEWQESKRFRWGDSIATFEDSRRRGFIHLWNSINPKYLWESNPWIFAYIFRRA